MRGASAYVRIMRQETAKRGTRRVLARFAASLLLLAGTVPAFAIEMNLNRPRPIVTDRDAGIDLNALENRLLRQQYLQDQQRERQQDREAISPRTADPPVKVPKPSCRVETFGNGSVGTACR